VAALMTEGRFRRAYIGIAGGPRPLPPRLSRQVDRERGVEIVQVVEASPAAQAGLRPEDLILDLDGVAMNGVDDLQRLMVSDAIGRTLPVRLYRDGRVLTVEVTPVELST
jgi:serine protease Do